MGGETEELFEKFLQEITEPAKQALYEETASPGSAGILPAVLSPSRRLALPK